MTESIEDLPDWPRDGQVAKHLVKNHPWEGWTQWSRSTNNQQEPNEVDAAVEALDAQNVDHTVRNINGQIVRFSRSKISIGRGDWHPKVFNRECKGCSFFAPLENLPRSLVTHLEQLNRGKPEGLCLFGQDGRENLRKVLYLKETPGKCQISPPTRKFREAIKRRQGVLFV